MTIENDNYNVIVNDSTLDFDKLEFLDSQKKIVRKWKPINNNKVAVELQVKLDKNKPNHCILLSSRFNENSVEPNPPFPGWFLQVGGNVFSLAFGNGKTWQSVKTKAVEYDKWYHIAFILDNESKKVEIYLDGKKTFKNNITFKPPCDTLVIGGLSPRNNEQFNFKGEMKNIKFGSNMNIFKKKIEDKDIDITSCLGKLSILKINIVNINNDIISLQNILNQIESWKLRGAEIDTLLLENQIKYMQSEIANFYKEFEKECIELKNFDDNIRTENDNIINENTEYLDTYDIILNNFLKDLDTLNKIVKDLTSYSKLGVKLGDAFQVIDEQKEEIIKKILDCEMILEQNINKTSNIMNIVNINDNQ
tara:strand:+ start:2142 stop:3233 length:1092 start_codon:yes stop_codon:yes gene_type:complete